MRLILRAVFMRHIMVPKNRWNYDAVEKVNNSVYRHG
jgi:hypothetical protein